MLKTCASVHPGEMPTYLQSVSTVTTANFSCMTMKIKKVGVNVISKGTHDVPFHRAWFCRGAATATVSCHRLDQDKS